MNKQLISIKSKGFDEAYDLLKQSFPPAEIRSYEKTRRLLSHPRYRLMGFDNEHQQMCGLIAEWDLDTFMFIEHLAINPNSRGQGIGSGLMRVYLNHVYKPVVLEVESPTDKLKRRRVHFYKRLGFAFNSFGYVQPSLQPTIDLVYLNIMSYPGAVSKEEFLILKEKIMDTVYEEPFTLDD